VEPKFCKKNSKWHFWTFFLTAMACRLSGIDSTNVLRHPSHKNPKNIKNGNSEDKSKLI
jgi:hypothetical protein